MVFGLQKMRHMNQATIKTVILGLGFASLLICGVAAANDPNDTDVPTDDTEPLTQQQVEILFDGRNLDKDFRRYQRRRDQYENFVAYAYETSIHRYASGKRRRRAGGIMLGISAGLIAVGGWVLYQGNKKEEEARSGDDDTDSGGGLISLGGLCLSAAATALLFNGVISLAIGESRMQTYGKAIEKLHPFVKYYAPDTEKRYRRARIGIFGNRHGAGLAISAVF